MDNATITIIVAVIGVCISIVTFFLGQKKSNTDDGMELGKFMGEIRADIKNIRSDIKELKEDRANMDEAISRAIKQHERAYHSNRQD